MHQPFEGEIIYIIGNGLDNRTAVIECNVIDFHGHLSFKCTDGRCGFITPTVIGDAFDTREEAQKALDDLDNYITYRMSSHKKK